MERDAPHFVINPEQIGDSHKKLIVNTPDLSNEELSQYYFYATFMPPGDSKFIVSFDGITDKDSYHFIRSQIPPSSQEVILHKKRTKKKLMIRQFNKRLSVFRDWQEDTEDTLKMSLDCDFQNSRIRKFIKDYDEYENVYALFLNNIVKIKEIFDHSIGVSSYPYISWLEFCNLSTKWNILDKGT